MEIIIAGRGRLADAFIVRCLKEHVEYQLWDQATGSAQDRRETVVIHAGSGKQLPEIIDFCAQSRTVILQGSGNVEAYMPVRPSCPVITIPNFDLDVIRLVTGLPEAARHLEKLNLKPTEILESHRREKEHVSATALWMARTLGLPESVIVSERNPKKQLKLGVPKLRLNDHAYLRVTFSGRLGHTQEFVKHVYGYESYASGGIQLARLTIPLQFTFTPGMYAIEDLLRRLPEDTE